MQFTTILLSLSAVLTTILASPVDTSAASPLVERACAYDDCAACEDYCWNGESTTPHPFPFTLSWTRILISNRYPMPSWPQLRDQPGDLLHSLY
jgi:hypothetical protein